MSNYPQTAAQPLVTQAKDEADETLWTQFTQQRLKAWQTLLPPAWVISLYAVGGLLFIGLGVALLLMSWDVEEYTARYTDVTLDANGVGEVEILVTKTMEPPIWVYYQLDAFHQNHRRYVKSRDDKQLQAAEPLEVTEGALAACKPAVMGDAGRPLYPCGLVARSVFNDSFALLTKETDKDTWNRLQIDSSAKTIAWAADVDGKFANYDPEAVHAKTAKANQALLDMWLLQRFPPVTCEQNEISETKPYRPAYVSTREEPDSGVKVADCRGYFTKPTCKFEDIKGESIECPSAEYKLVPQDDWGLTSGHFIVWMRVAGLPTFRKLWGKVDQRIPAGTRLKVYTASNFPVKGFHGQKALVISTSSPLGGRNDFLGFGYIVVGGCCLIFGGWFLWKHLST